MSEYEARWETNLVTPCSLFLRVVVFEDFKFALPIDLTLCYLQRESQGTFALSVGLFLSSFISVLQSLRFLVLVLPPRTSRKVRCHSKNMIENKKQFLLWGYQFFLIQAQFLYVYGRLENSIVLTINGACKLWGQMTGCLLPILY